MAEDFKNKGNQAFKSNDTKSAIEFYSKALEIEPENTSVIGNRSACHLAAGDYNNALADAQLLVKLKPNVGKSYLRLGLAQKYLGKLEEASSSLKKGLEFEPENEQLKSNLAEIEHQQRSQAENQGMNAIAKMFSDPQKLARLSQNPKTSAYMTQPDFLQMLATIRQNPQMINMYLSDPRFMEAFSVMIGIDMAAASSGRGNSNGPSSFGNDEYMAENSQQQQKQEESSKGSSSSSSEPASASSQKVEPTKEKSPEEIEAESLKQQGNTLYSQKKFGEALELYAKAIDLQPKNIVYRLNRAACLLELGDTKKCIGDCEEAIDVGRSAGADSALLAKAYTRIASAYLRENNLPEAIKQYRLSLTEKRSPEIQKKVDELELTLKRQQEEEYLSEEKCQEAKKLGNDLFKQGKFPEAIKEYKEALKRNPKEFIIHYNLGITYMKLGEFGIAAKEMEKCLESDPKHIKSLLGLGQCHFFMKDYQKALEVFSRGMELDPNNEAFKEHLLKVQDQLQNQTEFDEERYKRSLNDPEVRAILSDPVMMQVLKDLQENPQSAQKHMANIKIRDSIGKLFASGFLQNAPRKPQQKQ